MQTNCQSYICILWSIKITIWVISLSQFQENTHRIFRLQRTDTSILYVNSRTVLWRNLYLIPDIDIRVILETRWLRAFEIAFEIVRIPLAFRDIENSLREESPGGKKRLCDMNLLNVALSYSSGTNIQISFFAGQADGQTRRLASKGVYVEALRKWHDISPISI